jgi:hypothetical protein
MRQGPGTARGPQGTYPVGFSGPAEKTEAATRGSHEASFVRCPAAGQLAAVRRELARAHWFATASNL